MVRKDYKYIYGPVFSWRLGRSLGIDAVCAKEGKICSFDCLYCQAGKTLVFSKRRKVFVPTRNIIREMKSLPPLKIDYITFSGRGEPTLAKNLGRIIKAVRKIRKEKIAVLTNSSLIDREDVRKDLLWADFVIAKLDASSQESFVKIDRPMAGLKLKRIVKALKKFQSKYKGRLAVQIMFLGENRNEAEKIARLLKEINPDEVQINTPLRRCAVKPLSKKAIWQIKKHFGDFKTVSVYESKKKKVEPIFAKDVLKRRCQMN